MTTFLSELRHLAIEAEATEGTDPVVAAADALIIARNCEYTPELEFFERQVRRNTFSPIQAVPGIRHGGISFEFDLAANTTATADWSAALIGCGFAKTGSAGTETYQPAAAGSASVTIADYVFPVSGNPYRRALVGARGEVEFSAVAGGTLMAKCSFLGAYQAPTSPSALSTPSYDSEQATPPRFAGVGFALTAGGLISTEAILASWSLKMNNVLTPRVDASTGTSGIPSVAMTGRAPSGSFEVELPAFADWDLYAALAAGTTGSMSFAIGTTPLKLTFTLGNVMMKAAAPVNAGGIERVRIDYSAYATAIANSDEITIVQS